MNHQPSDDLNHGAAERPDGQREDLPDRRSRATAGSVTPEQPLPDEPHIRRIIAAYADAAKKAAEEANAKPRKGARRQQRKGAAPSASQSPSAAYSYVFSFTARAPAIVKAVNAFATCERFVTVDELHFRRDRDAMAEALGGEANKKNEAQAESGRRRRRRGGGGSPAAESAAAPKVPEGIVTDPVLAEPFTVTMAVTVHDFRSLEESDKDKAEEGKK